MSINPKVHIDRNDIYAKISVLCNAQNRFNNDSFCGCFAEISNATRTFDHTSYLAETWLKLGS